MQARSKPSVAILSMAFSAGMSVPALAQQQAPTELGTVLVQSSRLQDVPEAVRPDAGALSARRAASSDTASLLQDVPGVSLYGAGGVSSLPAIHGMADDRLRIRVDGMDLISACANHMNPALSYIDPSRVAAAEVYAGITPVSAGGDSIGGSIIVDSARPVFAEAGQGSLVQGRLGGFYRSNGNAWGANVGVTAATETFSASYSGSTAESDNYRAAKKFKADAVSVSTLSQRWVAGDEVASSEYKAQNHRLVLAGRAENHQLELSLGKQFIPYQGFPNQRMDMTDNSSEQINLRYTGNFAWGMLQARAYQERTSHTMNFLEARRVTVNGMPMDTRGETQGLLVKADLPLSERDLLRFGAELQRYRLDDWWDPVSATPGMMAPNPFWNINGGQRDRADVFAEWEARWSPQWQSEAGIRVGQVRMDTGRVQGYNNLVAGMTAYGDPNDPASIPGAFNARDRARRDTNVDVTLATRYTASEHAEYDLGLARKTRSPNLYERYTWSTNNTMAMNMINWTGDANGYVGNLDLKPEVAHTVSATADWHDGDRKEGRQLRITPYYTLVDNYIDAARCTGGTSPSPCVAANASGGEKFVYLRFVNQQAELYGADISGRLPLGRVAGLGQFAFSGVVNYTQGKNRTTGDHLYNIMPLNARLALNHQLGGWSSTAEWQLVAGKHAVSQTRNELQTSGYGLFNLRTGREWKDFRLDVGIDNVFNKFYNLPLGGAYVGQRVAAWGTPVPGMGRSLYIGASLKF